MRTLLVITMVIASMWGRTMAQVPALDNATVVSGFESGIAGAEIRYHSSIPQARDALLVRATDGTSTMAWCTAAVPEGPLADFVTFVWLAGLGSNPGRGAFTLEIDGRPEFEFYTDGRDDWAITSEAGATLSFHRDMIDQHDDRFGFMYLKLPAARVQPGRALELGVRGGRSGLPSWCMTFEFGLSDAMTFRSLPAIVERDGQSFQLGEAGLLHFGPPRNARILVDGELLKDAPVRFGFNSLKVDLPLVAAPTTAVYRLEIGDQVRTGQLDLRPVRKWRVNFVQHTHTDIGYTRPQTEILAEHLRFIDTALDYCDNTDGYPDEAQFRWTCEASWPVAEYLRTRPADQIERLKHRVAEGRIELTGLFFNFDELPGERLQGASLQALGDFRAAGLAAEVAMQNDVNGVGWCLADYLPRVGVKYLNMGTHGHRALICFDRPTLFWWESPAGNRMLAYRGEHYMLGNTALKIHAGDFDAFEHALLTYLDELDAKGYPHDLISIQHSGFLTDNSPPSTHASEMIAQWNRRYAWPRLRTATAAAFFREMEAAHGDEFPVIRGAWPDWWTDGFGASAREVAVVREAQSDLIANTGGLTLAALMGSTMPTGLAADLDAIDSALLFYTEHTVGYEGSVSEPFCRKTMDQRAMKESYAWEAGRRAKMLGETALGLLQSHVPRTEQPSLLVVNTLGWDRGGLMRVYIDHQILPRHRDFRIVDQDGHPARAQALEHRSDGTDWAIWVDDIPALGYRQFGIKVGEGSPADEPVEPVPDGVVENPWYRVTVDPDRGTISSLYDKDLGCELVDQTAPHGLGEFILERLGNRSQLEAFRLDDYTRESLDEVRLDGHEQGPVWDTLRFKGTTPTAMDGSQVVVEIRLFHTTKRIDLHYAINKALITDPEGIYIALPFGLDDGTLALEVAGGEMRAGIDQIPGSANDWNTVQGYARLVNDEAQVIVSSRECPLMQFGGINTGRYRAGARPASGHMYGWPMNNYWVTNFNADQHGGHAWTYSLTSAAGNDRTDAVRFGWENRIPLLPRVRAGGGPGRELPARSLVGGWPDNVLLIQARPTADGGSTVIQVREVAGRAVELRLTDEITGRPLRLEAVDVLGEAIPQGAARLEPLASGFFRVSRFDP